MPQTDREQLQIHACLNCHKMSPWQRRDCAGQWEDKGPLNCDASKAEYSRPQEVGKWVFLVTGFDCLSYLLLFQLLISFKIRYPSFCFVLVFFLRCFVVFFLLTLCLFDRGSYIAHVGLELLIWLKMTLNPGFSCFHLLSAGITGWSQLTSLLCYFVSLGSRKWNVQK